MRNTKTILTAAIAAATLAAGVSAAGESAAASRHYYRHDNSGTALAAGIAGLALGAALAGNGGGYYAPSYAYAPRYAYGPHYAYVPAYRAYYAPGYYGYGYRHRPHVCAVWARDRWGRPFRTTAWC